VCHRWRRLLISDKDHPICEPATPMSAATWLASIVATCLILLLFQKILWLVMPGLLALALYYACGHWSNPWCVPACASAPPPLSWLASSSSPPCW